VGELVVPIPDDVAQQRSIPLFPHIDHQQRLGLGERGEPDELSGESKADLSLREFLNDILADRRPPTSACAGPCRPLLVPLGKGVVRPPVHHAPGASQTGRACAERLKGIRL
jgi:hypothetical protein